MMGQSELYVMTELQVCDDTHIIHTEEKKTDQHTLMNLLAHTDTHYTHTKMQANKHTLTHIEN